MNTELEIQEIIKKNLPQQVGDVLKVRLEQAEKDAKKVIELEEKLKQFQTIINEKQSELLAYKLCDERNLKLDEKEKVLNKKQHDLDLEILQQKFESEKDKSDFAKSVALGLVRNTEFRKSVFDSENQQGFYKDNVWVQPMPINKNLNETKSAE